MTEDEAKKRWCPFSFNNPDEAMQYCIGSACMAWRWDKEVVSETKRGALEKNSDTRGHCGLAGKP